MPSTSEMAVDIRPVVSDSARAEPTVGWLRSAGNCDQGARATSATSGSPSNARASPAGIHRAGDRKPCRLRRAEACTVKDLLSGRREHVGNEGRSHIFIGGCRQLGDRVLPDGG